MNISHKNQSAIVAVTKRIIIYGIMFFILGVAQCSFFNELSFLSAVPNIVLGGVAAIALFDSQRTAVICGIVSGFMIDALGGSGVSLSPVALLCVALLCSEIAKKMLPSIISWVIILLPAALLGSLFTVVNILLSVGKFSFTAVFKTVLLPELILTVIFSIPLFFIVKLCARLADAKSKFKI